MPYRPRHARSVNIRKLGKEVTATKGTPMKYFFEDSERADRVENEDDEAKTVSRLLRLRAKAESSGNLERVAKVDWCLSWTAYKRYAEP
jgi:hypothetical protein